MTGVQTCALPICRVVGARVRFIQEIGRVLRAAPGKTEAVVLDPHNLLGTFHFSYEEMLGWQEPDDPDPLDEERTIEEEACGEEDAEGNPREPIRVRAARTTALARYVRQLHLALVAEGKTPPPNARPGNWRMDPATDKQRWAVAKRAGVVSRLDAEHATFIRKIAKASDAINKGIASDLMELFNGLDALPVGTTWTPASPVLIPPTTALLAVVDPRVYVAGALRASVAAIAIVQGQTVLYEGARPRKRGDGSRSLTARALWLAVNRYGAAEVAADIPEVVAREEQDLAPARVYVCDKTTNPAQRRVWAVIKRAEAERGE